MAKYKIKAPLKPANLKTRLRGTITRGQVLIVRYKLPSALIAAFILLVGLGGILFWLAKPYKPTPASTAAVNKPIPGPPTLEDAEKSITDHPLPGEDVKLSELSIGLQYLYKENFAKTESIGRKYLQDPDPTIQQKAKCLLQALYRTNNNPELKQYEGSCKDEE